MYGPGVSMLTIYKLFFPPVYRFHVVTASYLQTPRINFEGGFRADVNTINNNDLNYLLSIIPDKHAPVVGDNWNPQGTNTWIMIDCIVTSVVYTDENGDTQLLDSSNDDSVIGLPLVNNPERAFAKLVDVDPDQQQSSTIYGMDLGINWTPRNGIDQTDAFIGDFVPAVITRDIWVRQIRDSQESLHQPRASHSVSRIENVTWSTTLNSNTLKTLINPRISLSCFLCSTIPDHLMNPGSRTEMLSEALVLQKRESLFLFQKIE